MATDSDYNLTLQVVKQGFGSYLDGIVPPDVATACGAFSQTMRQIRNIDRIQVEKFAQVVANLETMKDLNVNGTDVPVDTPTATSSPPFIALGSGPQGSYTMSDFFGAMSGLPYIHHYKSAQGLLQRLATPYLKKIYEQMYLSVTWDNAAIGVTTTTTAVPDGAGGYNYYYQVTGVNVSAAGGGYSRGDAPPPIITIAGGGGATARVTKWDVTLDPTNPDTFGRINGVELATPGTPVLYGSGTSATPPAPPTITAEIQSPPEGTVAPPPPPAGAPVANFTASTTTGAPPLTVTFTDSSTNTPTSWAWDFNNDGVVDSTAQNPTHTYPTAGTYSVKLVATNASGSGTQIKTNYITVTTTPPGPVPVANFTSNTTNGFAPLNVSFTDTSTNNPTSWEWDFNGDGVVDSTAQNPTYTYTTTGTYTVRLLAINANGSNQVTKTNYITVNRANWVWRENFKTEIDATGLTDAMMEAVVWNGSKYVVTGYASIIGTSTNGITWTYHDTLRQLFPLSSMTSLNWNGSQFIAGGSAGEIATSPDGINWTKTTSLQNNTNWASSSVWDIEWGNGTYVAVGRNGQIATSPDGITWTFQNGLRTTAWGTTGWAYRIAFDGSQFLVVGDVGKAATSPDGINWTYQPGLANTFVSSTVNSLVWANGQFVAGENGITATSPDGINWTASTSLGDSQWGFSGGVVCDIAWNGSQYVAVGPEGRCAYSTDGLNWIYDTTLRTGSGGWGVRRANALVWNGTQWLVTGANSGIATAQGNLQ